MFIPTLKLSFVNLLANKKQSLLTMLGIIIGIASVITIISLGSGAQSLITNQIKKMGTNLMGVLPGKEEEGGGPPAIVRGIIITTLKKKDADALAAIPDVLGVLPLVLGNGIVNYNNISEEYSFWGAGYNYPLVQDVTLAAGRFFTKKEEETISRVAVLGKGVADKLFINENPLNKIIKINQKNFRVVGVLETQGSSFLVNQDEIVFVPYTAAQKQLLGIDYLHGIRLKAKNAEVIPAIKADIIRILRKNHHISNPKNDDFNISTQEQALNILGSVTDALKLFLAAIAGISLLVGGIGIMNMMLITVSKRTREIGIRKAIGAKKNDIIYQFLIETITITFLGGIIGISIGAGLSTLVAFMMRYLGYDWALIISPDSILISATISLLVGIIFGMYPSLKAAKLNPIEALRYE